MDGLLPHLHTRDVTLLLVSQASLAKLQACKNRMGWRIPWVSAAGTDFNFDYGGSYRPGAFGGPDEATLPPIVARNAAATGTGFPGYLSEAPAMSAFTHVNGTVCQTCATTWRGVEFMLPLIPGPRPGPKGRAEGGAWQTWIRRHREYA